MAAHYATPAEAAAFYSVSLRTVYSWISSGSLKAVRIGRTLRVDLDQFEDGESGQQARRRPRSHCSTPAFRRA